MERIYEHVCEHVVWVRLLVAGYDVREVQPCDMFPHTFHVEAVARLDRRFPGTVAHKRGRMTRANPW